MFPARSIPRYALLCGVLMTGLCQAATLLTDNFDSGAASSEWGRSSAVTINPGGPSGSTNYATVTGTTSASAGLGDQVNRANNFVIDFYFRVQTAASTVRQFNIGISTANNNPAQGDATINLRIQNNAFGIYQGTSSSWQAVVGMGTVTPGTWYRMQIEGTGWGTAGASYALRLFAADGTTSLASVSNLTTVQNGSITGAFTYGGGNLDGTLRSFIFSTTYGDNPGFDLDNVLVTGDLVPEPSTALLSGAAAFLLLRRRRR